MSGTLWLVPNTLDLGSNGSAAPDIRDILPLGVLRTAAGLRHWVAENAKTTRLLLKRIDAVVPLSVPLQQVSIVELPRPGKGGAAAPIADLTPLLQPALEGHDLGLVSEAGLPAVADPGAALVLAAHALHITVTALPGPSALLLALAASGLNGQSFAFVGYVPVPPAERAARLRELEALSRQGAQTQLIIETPYRNEALLASLLATLQAPTRLSVSCGITLPGGFSRTDTVAQWRARPQALPVDMPAVFALLAG